MRVSTSIPLSVVHLPREVKAQLRVTPADGGIVIAPAMVADCEDIDGVDAAIQVCCHCFLLNSCAERRRWPRMYGNRDGPAENEA